MIFRSHNMAQGAKKSGGQWRKTSQKPLRCRLLRPFSYERLAGQHNGSSCGAGKAVPVLHGVWSLVVQLGARRSLLFVFQCGEARVEDALTPPAPAFAPAQRCGGAGAKSTRARTVWKELLWDSRRGLVRAWLSGHLIVLVQAVGECCMGLFRLPPPE